MPASPRRLLAWALAGALAGAAWPLAGLAFANVEVGQAVGDVELPTLAGGKAHLLSPKALANVFLFFRANHEHSLETLRRMAECEREFTGKPVRWVAVVSDGDDREAVAAAVSEAGLRMPVLLDVGDELYGRLGVRLHPVIGIADGQGTLLDYVPFHKINYCDMVRVRIRHALHEVDRAAVDRVDHPPKALMPSEIPGAVGRRHLKLGGMLLKSKQPAKAEAEARTALQTLPDDAGAHALLGAALAAQGRCAEAAPSLDRALALDPKSALAAEGRKACPGPRK